MRAPTSSPFSSPRRPSPRPPRSRKSASRVDPDGPVTVGTPVEVTVTVLVPTYMPQPPVWPDLQISDAITRLPDRATHPVTQRIGQESWSGLSRTWEIVPQRPADFDLGSPTVRVTYADPATNAPIAAAVESPRHRLLGHAAAGRRRDRPVRRGNRPDRHRHAWTAFQRLPSQATPSP